MVMNWTTDYFSIFQAMVIEAGYRSGNGLYRPRDAAAWDKKGYQGLDMQQILC